MGAMQLLRWIATGCFFLAVPLFLVLTNVRVATMEPRIYDYSFDRYAVTETTGMDTAQLRGAARDIVHYFQDSRPLLTTRAVIHGQEQPVFAQKEVLHMQDVKALFHTVFTIHQIALAYLLAYVGAVFVWAHERSLPTLGTQLVRAGTVTVSVLAIAAVAAFVGFDSLFRLFHVLSFANDFWELDPATDRLIQMFPRDFWFMVTLAIGVATMMEGALLILAGHGLRAWVDRPGRPAATTEASSSTSAPWRP
jgi:integral membrane protein (TIGR01906 family)